jgi:pimeloyl-ACP methyl ester carboxylesterase
MTQVALAQGTIEYRDEGSGPTLVFLHGALVDGRLWDPVVERLSSRFRCVVPELPLGSHRTPMPADADLSPQGLAALVASFLEALDLRDVTLIGNDSGGAISQLVVGRHPERVARLVLTPCDAFEVFPPKAFKPMVAMARFPRAFRAGLLPMRARSARRLPIAYGWLAKRPIPDDVTDGWVLRALDDAAILRDACKVFGGLDPHALLDNAPQLAEFDGPVLIAWATEDRFFDEDLARRLAAVFRHARVERIDDAYTFVSWDRPDRLAELVGAFVAEPAAAPA